MATYRDPFPEIWAALTVDRLLTLFNRFDPKPHGNHITLRCPGCDRPEAFIYEPTNGKGPGIHCNRKNNCGYEATVWSWIEAEHNGDGKAALTALAALTGVRLDDAAPYDPRAARRREQARVWDIKPAQPLKQFDIPAGLDERQAHYQSSLAGSNGQRYIEARGLALDEALAMGFGYCPKFSGSRDERVTYPMRNQAGAIVGFEGRYCSPGEMPAAVRKCWADTEAKGAGLFLPSGRFQVGGNVDRDADSLHIAEGPFDAAALHVAGLNACATLGTSYPDWLIRACNFRHVWAAHDADAAGDQAEAKLQTALIGATVHRHRPPAGDWGDMLQRTRPELLAAAGGGIVRRPDPESMQSELAAITKKMDFVRSGKWRGRYELADLTARIQADIDSFAAKCDLPGRGFTDPGDDFAADALAGLRYDFDNLAPHLQAPILDPETIPAATVETLTDTLDLGNTGADRTHR